MENAIAVLASTPPSASTPWHKSFKSSFVALGRINELEAQLGLPKTEKVKPLVASRQRIAELESLLAAKATAPAAAAPPHSVASNLTGRARFNASVARDAAARPTAKSHPELHGREKFCASIQVSGPAQI